MYEPTDPTSSIQYIIYNAPYGCVQKMVKVHEFDKDSSEVQQAIRNHQQHNYEIYSKGEDKVISSSVNYIEGGSDDDKISQYFDNISGKVYKVNNLSGEVIDSVESDEHKGDEVVQLLGTAANAYLEEFFGENKHCVAIKNGDDYHLILTCKTKNPESFYNGSWTSHYTYIASESKLTGSVTLKAHNYENGNVHFLDTRTIDEGLSVTPSSPKDFAEKFVTTFMGIERKLVKRLLQHFEEDAEELFKSIRVSLPYTMERIDWDVNIQKVVQTLRDNEEKI